MKRTLFVSFAIFTLAVAQGQTPTITSGGTVNSADYSRSFAPGALISIFGANLATSTAQPSAFPLPTTLGGASVLVGGNAIPLWYASPTQINAELPFSLSTGPVQVQVKTASGTSNIDSITVAAQAPKFFTVDFSGAGTAVATNPSYQILTTSLPAKPADVIILWMNSLGPTTGTPVAGQPAPGQTQGTSALTLLSTPTVTINGINSPVLAAALSPGSSGLYQVNVQVPFSLITGPLVIQVTVGGVTTQTNVTIPFRQLGFFYTLLGGKTISGQTYTAAAGANSSVALRNSDQLTWGSTGYNAWSNSTGLGSQFTSATSVALTLKNGATTVFDNNGIEDGSGAAFYNNKGGPSNAQKPGLADLYSSSNYFPLVFSGYFKLTQPTTVTQLIGYFDALGNQTFPFDPANAYVKYRMNIYSNTSAVLPKETGGFTGDVFSSDTTAGTFAYSATNVNMVSSGANDAPKPVYRLSFTTANPVTLPAGEYWFTQDVSVRATPGSSSTAQAIRSDEFSALLPEQRPAAAVRINLAGQDLEYRPAPELKTPVVVRPSLPAEMQ